MNRRQALKSIVLAPLSLYFLGGVAAQTLPELLWYQTPHRWHLEGQVCKVGLKATWPDGEQFGYTAVIWDVPEKPNIFSQGKIHPNYVLARERLTQAAFRKEASTWQESKFIIMGVKTAWKFF